MTNESFPTRIESLLQTIDLEKREAMMQSPEGQYYKQIVGLLHLETRQKIVSLLYSDLASNPSTVFSLHRDIVTVLNHYGYPLSTKDLDTIKSAYLAEGESDPEVQRFLLGCHPTFNAGTYLAFFNDWQLKEFLKAINKAE